MMDEANARVAIRREVAGHYGAPVEWWELEAKGIVSCDLINLIADMERDGELVYYTGVSGSGYRISPSAVHLVKEGAS